MSFKDLVDGYANGNKKEIKKTDLTPEEKALLETKDLDTLSARAKMRLQFLKNRIELEKQLAEEQKADLDD